ncbi:uncharacterized protein LOC142241319 [Haematobia irritans]|uniref:uncharacterized protein LOC142241319 n=1 Tax=Haematobia irritans TaxID=7368 RepID=UPI003F4F538E
MSRNGKKLIDISQNNYVDRRKSENENISELAVQLKNIESMLLLLDSEEDTVLINILKHLMDFGRKNNENIKHLRKTKLLDIILRKKCYRLSPNVNVRRFSLGLMSEMVESMDILKDLQTEKTLELLNMVLECYVSEEDEICMEYLSVIINKCLDDPQLARRTMEAALFREKLFHIMAISSDPDVIFNSLEILENILKILATQELQEMLSCPLFPMSRIICELTSEYMEMSRAALKVLRLLVLDVSSSNHPRMGPRIQIYMWEQLMKLFCESPMEKESKLVVDVMSAALRNEAMAQIFFQKNHFERYWERMAEVPSDQYDFCYALAVVNEAAAYDRFLPLLVEAKVTQKLLNCLLIPSEAIPATHILQGLNRMTKNSQALRQMVEAFEEGFLEKLLALFMNSDINIETREQGVDLVLNLLKYAFQKTAAILRDLKISRVLAMVYGQNSKFQSTDLLLSLLNLTECLAVNADYREELCKDDSLIKNLAILLSNSFSTTTLVNNIFCCLCSLVDEESARQALLQCYISSSIKRALKSSSILVKTSVTNFIMQTTRFPEFLEEYIDRGVLEVLIFNQKYAYTVPTWSTAIESVLSKSPTLKFCIRNHLDFTDTTVGRDFYVSKKKFEDYRIFQAILKEDVSPLHPVLVVNFDRAIAPEESVIRIAVSEDHGHTTDCEEWCYCRTPGDPTLPLYLREVNAKLQECEMSSLSKQKHQSVDFTNIANRVKVIAEVVARVLGKDLKLIDLNSPEECSQHIVECHLKQLAKGLHCTFIPLGLITSGCHFERSILFKALADQVGLPCTLQRSVDGRLLFNEVPLPLDMNTDVHCDPHTLKYMPWRMLRPTHIVDLMYDVGALYPLQSRQALQYMRLL